MRELSLEERLLVSGGWNDTSYYPGEDPGGPGDPGPSDPGPGGPGTGGTGTGSSGSNPGDYTGADIANIHVMDEEDAAFIGELFFSASGDVLTAYEPVVQGAYQGSGSGNNDMSDFLFSAFMSQSFNLPDARVINSLNAAGIAYYTQSNGSIYAPGYGYAVHSNNTGNGGSSGGGSYGGDGSPAYDENGQANIVVVGQRVAEHHNDIIGFGNDIVVTGQYDGYHLQPAGFAPFVFEGLKDIILGMIGNALYDSLFGGGKSEAEREAAHRAALAIFAERETAVANKFDPTLETHDLTVMGRHGEMFNGVVQNHTFFLDINNNGKFDARFAVNNGTVYADYGRGWSAPLFSPFADLKGF